MAQLTKRLAVKGFSAIPPHCAAILAEVWTSTPPMPENQGGSNFWTIQS